MDGNANQRKETNSSSLMELLKRYSERMNDRETLVKESTHPTRTSMKTNLDESYKDSSIQSQSKIPVHTLPSDLEKINYKAKWEESEAKYRLLERKHHQLESQTIKQMQEKIDQLQRESNQLKMIKQRLAEIGSCRQLTHEQFEQLKYFVNNNDPTALPIEIIANKNDFLQQTRKLREILLKHQDEFLIKIDQLITKKRKRIDDDRTDDEQND